MTVLFIAGDRVVPLRGTYRNQHHSISFDTFHPAAASNREKKLSEIEFESAARKGVTPPAYVRQHFGGQAIPKNYNSSGHLPYEGRRREVKEIAALDKRKISLPLLGGESLSAGSWRKRGSEVLIE